MLPDPHSESFKLLAMPHTNTLRPAYIFDLDGTLVDTAPDLLAATNAVLSARGRATIAPETLRHMVGFGARSLIAQAFEATGEAASDDALPGLVDIFLDHYRANIAVESRPFPGVEETLTTLSGEVRLAVLTNKPQDMADLLLSALGLDRFFTAIHGAGRLSVVKPDASVFHHVIEELGGADTGAVMIGDSATDLKTARASGVPAILVDYGYTPIPAAELGADALTGDFREIPALAKALLGG
jgi:phosphoglycolate phosphatase